MDFLILHVAGNNLFIMVQKKINFFFQFHTFHKYQFICLAEFMTSFPLPDNYQREAWHQLSDPKHYFWWDNMIF